MQMLSTVMAPRFCAEMMGNSVNLGRDGFSDRNKTEKTASSCRKMPRSTSAQKSFLQILAVPTAQSFWPGPFNNSLYSSCYHMPSSQGSRHQEVKQLDPACTFLGEKRAVLLSPSTEALALVTISTDTKEGLQELFRI